MHEISFIISTRDETPLVLQNTIDELIQTTRSKDYEIILIDDGSIEPVICQNKEVRLIRNPVPIGVSLCRRYGAKIANGDVLVWLDAHLTFDSNWLEYMMAYVDSGSLLCSAYWNYEQNDCHCWGGDFTWRTDRNYKLQKYPGFKLQGRTKFPGHGAFEIPAIIGACYMILRESYERIGGFSPLIRVWGVGDIDISIRSWLTGIGVKCVTDARVGHLTRNGFPYEVEWDHIEYNQLVTAKTVFGKNVIPLLEKAFLPLPKKVEKWLNEDKTQIQNWRNDIQSRRIISDTEFINKVAPSMKNLILD